MAKVYSAHPNGVVLRVFETRDVGAGMHQSQEVASVTVSHDGTEVDDDFLRKWREQHSGLDHLIRAEGEAKA